MRKEDTQAWLALAFIMPLGAFIAWAGSQHGLEFRSVPVFAVCAAIAFIVNWAIFVPSFLARTEHYFDLTGSVTYLSVVLVALTLANRYDSRAVLLASLITIWALRLGPFLFLRVRRQGQDRRFVQLKQSFPRFLMTWTLQGLWVLLTASCALAAMTSVHLVPVGAAAVAGLAIWLIGFAIEVVADRQKTRFNGAAENNGRFISTGLWSWSRHPNYFGEILLWLGIAIVALPVLRGWQYLTLISPLFVFVLLTRVSGIPMLEARANKRWGEDSDYQRYKASTPALWLRRPRKT